MGVQVPGLAVSTSLGPKHSGVRQTVSSRCSHSVPHSGSNQVILSGALKRIKKAHFSPGQVQSTYWNSVFTQLTASPRLRPETTPRSMFDPRDNFRVWSQAALEATWCSRSWQQQSLSHSCHFPKKGAGKYRNFPSTIKDTSVFGGIFS